MLEQADLFWISTVQSSGRPTSRRSLPCGSMMSSTSPGAARFRVVAERTSARPRHAAFLVAALPVPLHAGHPTTMASVCMGAGM